ncbi:MAG: flavin-dependent dehydrogenase [Candidatus Nitrosomirales archaeon]|jgi:flavin-dependent dehydrogenase
MKKFDAVIIGGGAAATSSAILLARQGLSVLSVERSNYQEWRAGETLMPDVSVSLHKLGVMNHFLQLHNIHSEAIYVSWGSLELYENHFIFNPYGTGWHIDRSGFDEMLTRAAEEAGAMALRGAQFVVASRNKGIWQITLRTKTETVIVQTPILIDATGRSAQPSRSQGAKRRIYDQLIGLVGILSPKSAAVSEPAMMLEATQNGWWYEVPLPDGRSLAACMTDKDIFTGSHVTPTSYWTTMLSKTIHVATRLRRFKLIGNVRIRDASTSRLDKAAGVGWVAVGDAASAYDPLAGNGIIKALESGINAAQSIISYYNGQRNSLQDYANHVVKGFSQYLLDRTDYYQREDRWSDSVFWRRRHDYLLQGDLDDPNLLAL